MASRHRRELFDVYETAPEDEIAFLKAEVSSVTSSRGGRH
jgi:hypothetical protein